MIGTVLELYNIALGWVAHSLVGYVTRDIRRRGNYPCTDVADPFIIQDSFSYPMLRHEDRSV